MMTAATMNAQVAGVIDFPLREPNNLGITTPRHHERLVRVQQLKVLYQRTPDGFWYCEELVVVGFGLNLDGAPLLSARLVSRPYLGRDQPPTDANDVTGMPQWIADAVHRHRPSGTVTWALEG